MVYPPKTEEAVVVVNYATTEFVNNRFEYYNEQLRNANKKIKLLVRLLVDKKIIGTELAKTFEETVPNDILDWYLDKVVKEGEKKDG